MKDDSLEICSFKLSSPCIYDCHFKMVLCLNLITPSNFLQVTEEKVIFNTKIYNSLSFLKLF